MITWKHPPMIALVLIILTLILHFTFPIRKIISFPYSLTGILLIILGLLVSVWGGKTFQKLKAPLIPGTKPTKTVTSGPFRFSRNPMYLGFVLILIGYGIILGSIIGFLAAVIFFLIMHFALIPFEEKLMKKHMGKKYLAYKSKVRRWI